MRLDHREDPFNTKKTRTENNTKGYFYTCGGYALETFSWFCPYKTDNRDEYIYDLLVDGFTPKEIIDILLEEDVKYMLDAFGKNIRLISNINELEEKEIGIAYRIHLEQFEDVPTEHNYYDDEGYSFYFDYDFHFRKYNNGIWSEKSGSSRIKEIEWDSNSTEGWEVTPTLIYTGPIVFFALKI